MRRLLPLQILSILLLGLSGIAKGDTVEVQMTNAHTFVPNHIQIQQGDVVVFRNISTTAKHTVTADPNIAKDPQDVELPEGVAPFDSGIIAPGGTFERSFDVAGSYKYFCRPHELHGMIGTIEVLPY